MKATQRDFAGIAPKAAKEARIFFFCGPDEAGSYEAANRIVSLLSEPGERIELSGAELRKDPVRLGDEARSTSLFGETRYIFVRAQGDEAHEAVANLLESDVDPCPVLIIANSATDKSRTAKLLANRPNALVAMFYPPDLRSVAGSVRGMAAAAGLRMDAEIAERIARAAGLDTRLAQSEISKLALYLDAAPEHPRTVDSVALEAIGAKTEDEGFAPIVDGVLGGDAQRLASELQRMHDLALNPVGLLLALERRTVQLAALAAKLRGGGDIASLLKAESAARRIFWKDQAVLAQQLRRWRGSRLKRLTSRLVALHQSMLVDSQNAELLISQELTEITRVSAR